MLLNGACSRLVPAHNCREHSAILLIAGCRAGRYVTVATRAAEAGVNMFTDPLWHIKYWNAAARADMRACVEHDACVAERVRELLQNPPGDHTIAGKLEKGKGAGDGMCSFALQ